VDQSTQTGHVQGGRDDVLRPDMLKLRADVKQLAHDAEVLKQWFAGELERALKEQITQRMNASTE